MGAPNIINQKEKKTRKVRLIYRVSNYVDYEIKINIQHNFNNYKIDSTKNLQTNKVRLILQHFKRRQYMLNFFVQYFR